MAKGVIKTDIMLRLEGWTKESEAPTLTLVGAKEMPVGSAIIGSMEVSASRFYQIMREQKEDGKLPVFRMMVIDPDAQAKQSELDKQKEKDKKSPKLDLSKKKDDKAGKDKKPTPAKKDDKKGTSHPLTNGEKAALRRKQVEDAEKAKVAALRKAANDKAAAKAKAAKAKATQARMDNKLGVANTGQAQPAPKGRKGAFAVA